MIEEVKKNESLMRIRISTDSISKIELITVKELSRSSILVNIDYDNINNPQYLIYYITGLVRLDEFIRRSNNMNNKEFFSLIISLCKNYLQCDLNNNLKMNRIDFSVNNVFIDPNNKKLRFIYLPYNNKGSNNPILGLKKLISNILSIYSSKNKIKESILLKINNYLQYNFDDVYKFVEFISSLNKKINDREEKSEINKENLDVNNSTIKVIGVVLAILTQLMTIILSIVVLNMRWDNSNYPLFILIFIGLVDLILIFLFVNYLIIPKNKANFNKGYLKEEIIIKDDSYDNRSNETTLLNEDIFSNGSETTLLEEVIMSGYLLREYGNNFEKIKITKKEFTIGRLSNKADYVLNNTTVGKEHAKIIYKNNKFYIVDLNSRNGTFVNDEKIRPMALYKLIDGDIISVSNEKFRFKI